MNYDEIFTVAFDFLDVQQRRTEFEPFIKMVMDIKPKIVLEIGTATGGTLYLFCKFLDPDLIISVDKPSENYDSDKYVSLNKESDKKNFVSFGKDVKLIVSDSHDAKTLDNIKEILNGKKLDLLFIDGDHTYEGVKKDFEMYGPLVRKGGIIAFHDISVNSPEMDNHVKEFWDEIKDKYKTTEFVSDKNEEDEKFYKKPVCDDRITFVKGYSGFSYPVRAVQSEKSNCSFSFVVYKHYKFPYGIGVIEVSEYNE